MLFLPEASAFLGETSQETVAQAQELDTSTVVERFRDLAKEHSLNMSFCLHEAAGGEKAYNTQVVLDERGEIKARYRKVHLFDVDVPRGPVLKESRYTVGGTDLVSCDVGGSFVLGLTTCYDLRFPEMYQALRYCHGVNLFSVPSAFTKPTGQAGHWSTLLRARAIENQSYIVASAQAGRHSERRESFGHSMISIRGAWSWRSSARRRRTSRSATWTLSWWKAYVSGCPSISTVRWGEPLWAGTRNDRLELSPLWKNNT